MAMKDPERALATLTGEVHGLFMVLQVLESVDNYI